MRKGSFLSWTVDQRCRNANEALRRCLSPRLAQRVAAGDTTATSTVLWTHSTNVGNVTFDYSTNSNFANLTGSVVANVTDALLPVKVELNDLTPGTRYYYRVTDAGELIGWHPSACQPRRATRRGLRFGVSGDWRGELAPLSLP